MCTAIAFKGSDLIYGFNLDVNPKVWNYSIIKNKKIFTVGITVGKTKYYTHGVTKEGRFSDVPYMNGEVFPVSKGIRRERIDLLTDRYLRGKYSFNDIMDIVKTKALTSPPAATLHSLIGDHDGSMIIVEPGYGYKKVEDNYAVITNFPVFAGLTDFSNPFFGKDRYDFAVSVLESAGNDYSAPEAMQLLCNVKQEGKWGTKVSFVWSRNENSVYWCTDGNFENIQIHRF